MYTKCAILEHGSLHEVYFELGQLRSDRIKTKKKELPALSFFA